MAAIASGGLTLVPSVRRIMTDIADLDVEAGFRPFKEAAGIAHQNYPYSSSTS
jgi:hypothetical protein